MIIYGWGHKKFKKFGPAQELCCSRCNNIVHLELVSVSTWFTLFFVPVIPYKSIYGLTCPICGMGIEIDKNEFDNLRRDLSQGHNRGFVNGDGTPKTETQLNYIQAMQEREDGHQAKQEELVNNIPIQSVPSKATAECAATIRLASYEKRFGAALIDFFLAIVPWVLIFTASDFGILTGSLLLITLFTVQASFHTVLGQSIGKKILKIKIVRFEDGVKGGFVRNFLVRSLLNNLFSLTFIYLIVDTAVILSPYRRCLHDLMAGTIVVDSK